MSEAGICSLSAKEASVLAHTLSNGRYVTGDADVIEMGKAGLLHDYGPQNLAGGMHYRHNDGPWANDAASMAGRTAETETTHQGSTALPPLSPRRLRPDILRMAESSGIRERSPMSEAFQGTHVFTAVRYRKIYVASSWRNFRQAGVVDKLRQDGHLVYDFKNPRPGDNGFHWSAIDPGWETWTLDQYRQALDHPIAKRGFASDFDAMKWADTFLLVLPCGRSAHLELGWACGQGKQTMILLDAMEPELMTKMVDHLCVTLTEARAILAG